MEEYIVKGIFITIEGPDGAGKSSVLKELAPKLKAVSEVEIIVTREPGGIPISEKIRQVILDPRNLEMDERTEALLYAAARRQHLVQKVIPALEQGKIVLCDRFVDSSLAYQGAGRKIGMEPIASINEFATEGLQPDLTLYLDVDSETGLHRIMKNRQLDMDRLDQESPQFHQRVRHGYLKLAEDYPERILTIDARLPLDQVIDTCYNQVLQKYPNYFIQ